MPKATINNTRRHCQKPIISTDRQGTSVTMIQLVYFSGV